MKAPKLDLQAVVDWLVRHGEKVVVGLVGAGALALVWGGLDAVRTLSVGDAQAPQAVKQAATQAEEHIARDRQPPADLLPPRTSLADAIDPWRKPLVPWKAGPSAGFTLVEPKSIALLDRPLFKERAKRTRPDVLPIEDLRAVAGLAVLPAPQRPVGPGDAVRPPPARPARPEPGAGRRPQRGGDPLAGRPDPNPPPEAGGPEAGPTGRIAPYVIVTGLIPVAKQQDEYRRRFADCGFRDPLRDVPLWSDFEIDRGVVGRDGKVEWTTIDLAAVAKGNAGERAAGGEGVPAELRLGDKDARLSKQTPVDFCALVPTRIDGTWELADLHPWAVDWLAAKLAEEEQKRDAEPQDIAQPGPGGEGPGFGAVEERSALPNEGRLEEDVAPFRMFRFVDFDVQPGRAYRYRVRLKVWNPNWDEDPERMRPHLADPALASERKLASPDAETSVAARVPDPTRVLVGTLETDEIKEMRLKPGTLEVLVLAPSEASGSFKLRGFVADPGALIDVDERFNAKNQRDRCRGEKIATGRLLLDARGRQDERDRFGAKAPQAGVPEPFEVLCLKPDGTFEFASVDDSARWLVEYGATLPPRSTKEDPAGLMPGDIQRPDLPLDPLARPGAGR